MTQEDLKITALDKTQVHAATKILSAAFNEKAARVQKEVVRSFSDDPERPVTFAASINDQVVGVIRYVDYSADVGEPYYSLFCLAVDPAFRNTGIGHALMEYTENYLRERLTADQQATISLIDATKKENPASVFYEKMGYAPGPEPRMQEEGPVLIKRVRALSKN
jgi:ribosomal protein S18 acetylase RimI-like enzyme